jgi:hypothetical protein
MIFGHAPIIFPAVLSVRMKYHPRFYLHLLLLEIAVAGRIVADLAGWWTVRQWAGLLAALAIILFLIQTVTSLSLAQPPTAPKRRPGTGKTILLGVIAPPATEQS